MILISDSMRASRNAGRFQYTLGGLDVNVVGKLRYTGLRRGDSRFCDESYWTV